MLRQTWKPPESDNYFSTQYYLNVHILIHSHLSRVALKIQSEENLKYKEHIKHGGTGL